MKDFGMYLVCNDHIEEVKNFLKQFFEEIKDEYNYSTWITFKIPNSSFKINLMEGLDQDITQNAVIEIYCESKEELERLSKKHNCKNESFLSEESAQKYQYNYIEIQGPKNICKVEISYCKDI